MKKKRIPELAITALALVFSPALHATEENHYFSATFGDLTTIVLPGTSLNQIQDVKIGDHSVLPELIQSVSTGEVVANDIDGSATISINEKTLESIRGNDELRFQKITGDFLTSNATATGNTFAATLSLNQPLVVTGVVFEKILNPDKNNKSLYGRFIAPTTITVPVSGGAGIEVKVSIGKTTKTAKVVTGGLYSVTFTNSECVSGAGKVQAFYNGYSVWKEFFPSCWGWGIQKSEINLLYNNGWPDISW